MFGMALTRQSLTMQSTSGEKSSRMCADKRRTLPATIVTIFSHMTRDVSVFVKCDAIFRLFFWKLPQIRTSNFRKLVWLKVCEVRNIIWVSLDIYYSFSSERILKIR